MYLCIIEHDDSKTTKADQIQKPVQFFGTPPRNVRLNFFAILSFVGILLIFYMFVYSARKSTVQKDAEEAYFLNNHEVAKAEVVRFSEHHSLNGGSWHSVVVKFVLNGKVHYTKPGGFYKYGDNDYDNAKALFAPKTVINIYYLPNDIDKFSVRSWNKDYYKARVKERHSGDDFLLFLTVFVSLLILRPIVVEYWLLKYGVATVGNIEDVRRAKPGWYYVSYSYKRRDKEYDNKNTVHISKRMAEGDPIIVFSLPNTPSFSSVYEAMTYLYSPNSTIVSNYSEIT